jgi:RNA polymerase sigma-70 factor, ECF subfamily
MTSATIAVHSTLRPGTLAITGTRAGSRLDTGSFESIHARYSGRIYAHAYRMTGNAEDARDLTQECFVRAWHARERMPPDAEVSPWLYRIASNLCLDLLRRRQRIHWRPWEAATHDALTRGDRDDQPEQHAVALETRDEVQQTLALLKPRYRTALLLREYDGCSCAEVGDILGISVPAVKSLLFRAREEFRCLYRAIEGQEDRVVT